MTLKFVVPVSIGEANVSVSNVALETEWTAGTYTLGQQLRVGEQIFEVSAASTTEAPSEAATDWFLVGPANRYAAFDTQIGLDQYRVVETSTTNNDSIQFTLTGLSRISGIALFGLVATDISIVATDVTPGDLLNTNYTIQDATPYNGSHWRWFFLPQSLERKYIDFGVSIPSGATIEVTVNNIGSVAQLSSFVAGVVSSFGTVTIDSSRSMRSRSIKKTEGTLTSLLRRTPSYTINYNVTLQDYEGDAFWRSLGDIDGISAVFSGSESNPQFTSYGFVSSAEETAKGNGISRVQLEVTTL